MVDVPRDPQSLPWRARRDQVLDIVRANPGIQPYAVWKQVGGALGVTVRAIRKLEERGQIRVVHRGRHRHLFQSAFPPDPARAALAADLSRPAVRETLRLIATLKRSTQAQLARQLGIAESTMSERVARLKRLGLIRVQRDDKGLTLLPSSDSPFKPQGLGREADPPLAHAAMGSRADSNAP